MKSSHRKLVMEEVEQFESNCIPERSLKRRKLASARQSSDDLDNDNHRDRISDLPEALLLDIVSRLEIRQAIRTSLLSKRWRYLWRSTPRLNFGYRQLESRVDKIAFIDECLYHHDKSSKLRELDIYIEYKYSLALTVDSWIRVANTCNVEDLKLDLLGNLAYREDRPLYKLPRRLFECGSLTQLTLTYCDLNLPVSLHLRSLKTLKLWDIELSSDAIERLTSSCPILEDLFLTCCNRYDDLNITIKNEHVKNLVIDFHSRSKEFIVTMCAPKVLSLRLGYFWPKKYDVKNLQSVMSAELRSARMYDRYRDPSKFLNANYSVALAELLHSLRHVKDLKVSSSCIGVLSLRKIHGLDPILLQATNIELDAGFTKWELPGIACLLQSAPSLENLTILTASFPEPKMEDEFVEEHDFDEKKYWKLQEPSPYSSVLQNIKIINIDKLSCRSSNYSIYHDQHYSEKYMVMENKIEFLRFLLENAKGLERMIVHTDRCHPDQSTTLAVKNQVTQKLTDFPKASPSVELLVK